MPAHFDDVTPRQRKQPSWLSHERRHSAPIIPVSLPRPPAVPLEMVPESPQAVAKPANDVPRHYKTEEPRESVAAPVGEDLRPSMSPAELETFVAERAVRLSAEQSPDIGRAVVSEALQRISDAHDRMVTELTARAVELATLISRRVIARELHTSKDIVVGLVREGLEVLNARDRVRVHLGPEFAVMQNALATHYSATGTAMDIVIDNTLPAHGCIVETDVGSVDESIESRLAAMLEATTDAGEA